MENVVKVNTIRDQHPDKLYATCRADNSYWRHYRASTKLGIDELAMMICKDVGCDLSYCQLLFGKGREGMQINNCDRQFNSLRECIVREKRVFRSIFGELDTRKDPNAIPEYLEKHYKEKEEKKKERKMMGQDAEDLQSKIDEMQEKANINQKKMNVGAYKQKKQEVMDQSYM